MKIQPGSTLILFILLHSLNSFSQLNDLISFPGADKTYLSIATGDGNYVAVSELEGLDDDDFIFTKFEPDGDILWSTPFYDLYEWEFGEYKIFCIPDGYAIFCGSHFFKFSSSGELLIDHIIEFTDLGYDPIPDDYEWAQFRDVTLTDTGYMFCSRSATTYDGSYDIFALTSFDFDLNTLWSRAYMDNDGYFDQLEWKDDLTYVMYLDWITDTKAIKVIDDATGDILNESNLDIYYSADAVLTEISDGFVTNIPGIIIKMNFEGDTVWKREYQYEIGDTGYLWTVGITELPGGSLVTLDYSMPDGYYGEYDILLKYYTANGDTIEQLKMGLDPYAFQIINFSCVENNLIFSGIYYDLDYTEHAFILLSDTLGNYQRLTIDGKIYYDANENLAYDAGEFTFQDIIIQADPEFYAVTQSSGDYSLELLSEGEYNFQSNLPAAWDICDPDEYSAELNEATVGDTLTGYDFLLNYTDPIMDVSIDLWSTPILIGQDYKYFITINNFGTQLAKDIVVDLTVFSQASYISSSPSPNSSVDTSYTWEIGDLPPYQPEHIVVEFNLPDDPELVGTFIQSIATMQDVVGDITTIDNADTCSLLLSYSYDPNHKSAVPDGLGINGSTDPETEWIEYTIEFQNTGTAPAIDIDIEDSIDTDFDLLSFQMLASSHAYTMDLRTPGIITWHFDNINLPDMETDFMGSSGFITYRVKINDGAGIGTRLTNTARIYFDANAAIVTNTTLNTLEEFTEGISEESEELNSRFTMYPNPFSNVIYFDDELTDYNFSRYELFSLEGKMISMGNISGNSIGFQNLPGGQYILKLISDDLILNTPLIHQ